MGSAMSKIKETKKEEQKMTVARTIFDLGLVRSLSEARRFVAPGAVRITVGKDTTWRSGGERSGDESDDSPC